MKNEFIPDEQEIELKYLGYGYSEKILWQQAFRYLREEFGVESFIYPTERGWYGYYINGNHYSTSLTYHDATLQCLKKIINLIKNPNVKTSGASTM